MPGGRKWALICGALGGALLIGYFASWVAIDRVEIGLSDFSATYVGATLLRQGDGASMYDQALQAQLRRVLDPADSGGNLPFVNPPLAAAVALPVTLFDLPTAYRLWGLLQVALVIAGLGLAVWAAPGRQALHREEVVAVALLALACVGTWRMLIQAQWDGVSAVGLGAAYACLRKNRPGAAGFVLAAASLIAKPQIALGLAAFVIGRRDRRLILGAAAGVGIAVLLSVLIAGIGGVAGFAGAVISTGTRFKLTSFASFIGVAAAVAGSTGAAYVLAGIGGLLALAAAAWLGSAVRARPARLEAGLAGAAILSVLATPHAYGHDLVLLVPAAAWCLATLVGAARQLAASVTPMAMAAWIAISAASAIDVVTGGAVPPGPLTPWALIAAAIMAGLVCARQGRLAGTAGVPSSVAATG
ncbi:MAG TPA: glycosyltransferase family 87 protein [Candidatus Binatia bacterium]|nr:glycosyltransferase family 87 protein [Candidatus Binatia bacterium]